jgi:comEA protein
MSSLKGVRIVKWSKLGVWFLMVGLASNFLFSSAKILRAQAVVQQVPEAKAALKEPVNVNSASLEELQKVKGIGPVMAERIMTYRQSNGGKFKTLEELRQVKGIGEAKFEKIKSQITV